MKVLAFVKRDVLLGLSYPSTLFMPFASAAVTVAGFAFISRIVSARAPLDAGGRHIDYLTYVVVNLAFMLLLNTALQAVPAALRRDQVAGTLEAMFASPTSLLAMIAGSAAWPMCFAAAQAATYLLFGGFFGIRYAHVDVALLALFLLLACVCTFAVSIFGASAVVLFKQQPPFSLMAGTAVTLLAGVLFPIALLPAPLRVLSWLLPLTHALRGLRAAVVGASPQAVAPDALWLAVASAVLVPCALAALQAAVRRAKRDGSLAGY
jgi:ABC-2 type transport system permease protein